MPNPTTAPAIEAADGRTGSAGRSPQGVSSTRPGRVDEVGLWTRPAARCPEGAEGGNIVPLSSSPPDKASTFRQGHPSGLEYSTPPAATPPRLPARSDLHFWHFAGAFQDHHRDGPPILVGEDEPVSSPVRAPNGPSGRCPVPTAVGGHRRQTPAREVRPRPASPHNWTAYLPVAGKMIHLCHCDYYRLPIPQG